MGAGVVALYLERDRHRPADEITGRSGLVKDGLPDPFEWGAHRNRSSIPSFELVSWRVSNGALWREWSINMNMQEQQVACPSAQHFLQ